MNVRTIRYKTLIDTTGFDAGVRDMARAADRIASDVAAKLGSIKAPAMKSSGSGMSGEGPGGSPGGSVPDMSQLAGQIAPLANKVSSSIQGAMRPLEQFAAKFGAQFEQVGGTIIAISRRIDNHLKFPVFDRAIDGIRTRLQGTFETAEGKALKFAKGFDAALAGIQGFSKLRHVIESIGDVGSKSLAKIKIPNLNPATASMSALSGATKTAATSFKGLGFEIAAALGIFGLAFKAVSSLVELFKQGTMGAVDLAETYSKVGTVFGAETPKITGQADDLAKRFGLVKGPILDAAASFGLIGKAANLNANGTSALATQMTSLAADASSFYNIPLDDALNKLRSGLIGEAEPMRSLGVLLSETAVQNEAFRLGLARNKDEIDDQIKVQARMSLIASGLADATGDLERTQGSASNQFRKFTGTITNLAVSIGTALMPTISTILGLFNELTTWIGGSFEDSKATFEGWGETVATVFEYAGAIVRNWPASLEVAKLYVAQFANNVVEYFEVIGPNASNIAKYVADNWLFLIGDAFDAIGVMIKNLWGNFQKLGESIGKWLADPTKGFEVKFDGLLKGAQAMAGKLPEIIKPKLTDMSKQIGEAMKPIKDDVTMRREAAAKVKAASDNAPKGMVAPDGIGGNDMQALAKFIDSDIREQVKTPMEKYSEGMAKLRKAFDAGLIDEETMNRGEKVVRKDAKFDTTAKLSGAVELGSGDAYSSIVAAISGQSKDPMKEVGRNTKRTADNSHEQLIETRKLNRAIASFANTMPIGG